MGVQRKTGKRRQYTAEFTHEAVRLVTEGGLSMAQVARNLGLDDNLVSRWKKFLCWFVCPCGRCNGDDDRIYCPLYRGKFRGRRTKLKMNLYRSTPRCLPGILLLCCGPVAHRVAAQPPTPRNEPTGRTQTTPLPDTGGIVLGNPDAAPSQLHQIYTLLQKFRAKHAGKHPAKSTALIQELIKDPQSYGFKSYDESFLVFVNSDSQYQPGVLEPNRYSAYSIAVARADGSLLDTPKMAGTRDIWALTTIYFHNNMTGLTNNPVGFYVVLWDTGEVERIPYDLVLSVPRGQSLVSPFFPGQAGIPADALTYDERFQ